MDKETCKCATYELKVDGCEKKELQKCLKTKIKDEDRSVEKKGKIIFLYPCLSINDFWSH